MSFVCFNGSFYPSDLPLFAADHPLLKWGAGVFETMRAKEGSILLLPSHVQRLHAGLGILSLSAPFNEKGLASYALELLEKNGCAHSARLRLTVFRDQYGETAFLMEAIEYPPFSFSEQGITTGIYPHFKKSLDSFSPFKTCSYLPYHSAAHFATEKGWDDALVLSHSGGIAESSRSNLFLIRDETVFTPCLQSGCVEGVMRRHLLASMEKDGVKLVETNIEMKDLLDAEEVFLTNAIRGIQPIARFEEKQYRIDRSKQFFEHYVATI